MTDGLPHGEAEGSPRVPTPSSDTSGGASRAAYERGRIAHAGAVATFEARGRALGAARVLVAAAALALLAAIVWAHLGSWPWKALGVLAAGFAVLVVVHARVEGGKERALAAMRFHVRGLARLSLDWDGLEPHSGRFRSSEHPFTGDLDVFGKASLMQLVDATETRFGEERLAALLALRSVEPWPEPVIGRAQAARELAARFEFREALATAAGVLGRDKPDPTPLLGWAEATDGAWAATLARVAWLAPAALAIAFAGTRMGLIPVGWTVAAAVVVLGAGLWLGVRLAPMLASVSARQSAVTRWRATMLAVERQAFEAPLLAGLRGRLLGEGRPASEEMASLERIVGFADARNNEVFRFFVGPLLMWDVYCALALMRWRARAGARVRGWLEALGEIEALASLGAFAFEHPAFAWPEPVSDPVLEARELGHPLIAADRRVGNDVRLAGAGHALVVTGSNMSGKSTLLRAIGVNVVLACAGAPVCARSLRLGPLRVATSMRIEDSLAQGVSHFYAELQRLKRILDWAHEPGAVLFLLDEILHGTNSRERVAGARAVVRDLLAHGALGAVSTHDLGIAALERELGERVENVHFEEQVSGSSMSFDYVLRPGIVHSSNALRLMRAVGIAVSDDS